MSMTSTLQSLSGGEVKLLFGIIEKLSASHDQDALRKDIANDLLRLLKSDFITPLSPGIKFARYLRRKFSSPQMPPLLARRGNAKGEVREGDRGFCC